ncbi:MAG: TlpA family protein disulfide reductase [Planctomycetaceae bacterium]|nr:TlpA family protein disulfide reductase [Planctomycetaceae bacterium]
MSFAIRLSFAACLLCVPAVLNAEDREATSTLIWGNGDSLFGRVQSVKDETLVWDSPLFADPLSLDINVLSIIQFPEMADDELPPLKDEFRITLVDNSILSGNLKQITADTIVFESDIHGTIHAKKSDIRSLQKTDSNGLAFLGPRGKEGWTTNKSAQSASDLVEEDDGSLTAPKGDLKFSRQIRLPEKCELYFKVSSDRRPDFSISIGGPKGISTKRPRLEMWSDMFVLGAGSRFVPLQSVKSTQRELTFRIFIDFTKSLATVYDPQGKELGTIKSEKWEAKEGVLIEAINTKLTLQTLYVSEWDGKQPQILPEGVGGVYTNSGKSFSGELVGYSPETGMLQISPKADAASDSDTSDDENTLPQEVALKDIREIRLAPPGTTNRDEAETLVAWTNGGYLAGKMVRVTDSTITLQTPHATQPVTSSLSAVRHIRLPNSKEADGEPDRLFFDGGSLGGSLTMEDSDTPIRWKPVGGRNATTLVSRGNARFQRGEKPDQLPIDTSRFPDIVHLKDGDVIPGSVEAWTDTELRLTSPVSEVRQLPGKLVKAVELGVASTPKDIKFDAPNWSRIRGKVNITRNGRALGFRQNSTYRDTTFGQNETLEFRMSWTKRTYGLLYFNLFGGKSGQNPASVGIMLQPGQLICSSRPDQRQMQMQLFGGNQNGDQEGLVKLPNNEADVQITAINGEIVVSVNGAEVARVEASVSSADAKGLEIASGVSYMQTSSGFQNNQAGDLVTLSNMSTRPVSGATLRNVVGSEARERSLTIPRFRRDNPQTHVLIAPNGDVLRGQLKEITASEVVFESRLETFRFPKTRIAAVVRVDDDEDEEFPERVETAVQAKLDNGYILTMTPQRMQNGQIEGLSSVLGNCRIPARAIRDLFLGQAEGREEILSYVKWIRQEAVEPEWEMPEEGEEANALVGTIVDDFELPTLDGGTFRLSEHQDKVVILDFWATWCGPCAAALPEYIAAAGEFDESQVLFVAVNLEESKDRINEFLTQRRLAPLVAMDRGSVVARQFGVSGIPHSVILAPGMKVQHVTVGFKDGIRDTTVQRVKDLIANPPAF